MRGEREEREEMADLGGPSNSPPLLLSGDDSLGPQQLRLHVECLTLGGIRELDPLPPPLPLSPLSLPLKQHLPKTGCGTWRREKEKEGVFREVSMAYIIISSRPDQSME